MHAFQFARAFGLHTLPGIECLMLLLSYDISSLHRCPIFREKLRTILEISFRFPSVMLRAIAKPLDSETK